MKKEVIIGIIAVVVLALVALFMMRGSETSDLEIGEIVVAQCSQEEYETMVANAPAEGCATEWAVVCGEGSTWKYQCFGGQVVEQSEEELQAKLEAAKQEFFELCQQNPELECG
jgi:hypothetical protein